MLISHFSDSGFSSLQNSNIARYRWKQATVTEREVGNFYKLGPIQGASVLDNKFGLSNKVNYTIKIELFGYDDFTKEIEASMGLPLEGTLNTSSIVYYLSSGTYYTSSTSNTTTYSSTTTKNNTTVDHVSYSHVLTTSNGAETLSPIYNDDSYSYYGIYAKDFIPNLDLSGKKIQVTIYNTSTKSTYKCVIDSLPMNSCLLKIRSTKTADYSVILGEYYSESEDGVPNIDEDPINVYFDSCDYPCVEIQPNQFIDYLVSGNRTEYPRYSKLDTDTNNNATTFIYDRKDLLDKSNNYHAQNMLSNGWFCAKFSENSTSPNWSYVTTSSDDIIKISNNDLYAKKKSSDGTVSIEQTIDLADIWSNIGNDASFSLGIKYASSTDCCIKAIVYGPNDDYNLIKTDNQTLPAVIKSSYFGTPTSSYLASKEFHFNFNDSRFNSNYKTLKVEISMPNAGYLMIDRVTLELGDECNLLYCESPISNSLNNNVDISEIMYHGGWYDVYYKQTYLKRAWTYDLSAINPDDLESIELDSGLILKNFTPYIFTESGILPYYKGTSAPSDTKLFWIDTTEGSEGLKYYDADASGWKYVPVAFT